MDQGCKCNIDFACRKNGNKPAKDFLSSLDKSTYAKFVMLFQKLLESEDGKLSNRQKFKKLQGCDIWEFISKPYRIFCFRHQNTWYLTNGFVKKSNNTPRKEIETAEAIRKEFLGSI
jgi:phage-related protein